MRSDGLVSCSGWLVYHPLCPLRVAAGIRNAVVAALSAGSNHESHDGDCCATILRTTLLHQHVTCPTGPVQGQHVQTPAVQRILPLCGWGFGRHDKAQTHRRLGPLKISGDFKLRDPEAKGRGCGKHCGWGTKAWRLRGPFWRQEEEGRVNNVSGSFY